MLWYYYIQVDGCDTGEGGFRSFQRPRRMNPGNVLRAHRNTSTFESATGSALE